MKKKIFAAIVAALALVPARAAITAYPAGEGVPVASDFTVEVRQADGPWIGVDTYPVKVDEVVDARHNVRVASMAYFDFDGAPVEVRVCCLKADAIDSCRVRPLSYGITPSVDGKCLTFTLDRPRNLSVEVNGDIFHNLHLFAGAPDANRPSAKVLKNLKSIRT